MDKDFPRVNQLPPYVFDEIQTLKAAARKEGKDIIDFGMGNPDQATPEEILEKLRESSLKPSTHRYSQSKGIPRLRKSICDWYQRKFDVTLDPESEAVVTMGSKEGLGHLALATLDKGDAVLVPNPSYPIHPYGFVIAGADIRHVPIGEGIDFFAELESAVTSSFPKPKMLVLNFPGNPTTECVLSLIHISEPTRLLSISYAVFCLKKKSNSLLSVSLLLFFFPYNILLN